MKSENYTHYKVIGLMVIINLILIIFGSGNIANVIAAAFLVGLAVGMFGMEISFRK